MNQMQLGVTAMPGSTGLVDAVVASAEAV